MQTLERAIRMNGVTHLVFSKVDVLRTVGVWAAYDEGKEVRFESEKALKDFITTRFTAMGIAPENIYFSEDKDKI